MSIPPQPASTGRRRRKPLNLTLIKQIIVLLVAAITALGSALTGLGAQVAYAPMLTWMLGFPAEKAQGTAMRYAVFASAAAIAGAYMAMSSGVYASSTVAPLPDLYLIRALMLFVGATIGALASSPLAPAALVVNRRRIYQTLGVCLAVFVAAEAYHISVLDRQHFATWNTPVALFLLGAATGFLTQAMGLAGGTLLVPVLYFLGGFSAAQTVLLSLLVVALAALIPAWSYAKRGLVDATYSTVSIIGGLIGGYCGGYLLPHIGDKWILTLFSVVAMYFPAVELVNIVMKSPPKDNAS